jgi:hypothetical protein
MMTYNNYYLITWGVIVEKICTKCKQLLDINLFSIDKYKASGYRSACKKCSALEFKRYKTDNPTSYLKRLAASKIQRAVQKEVTPMQYWAHNGYHNAKNRAKKLNLEFGLTKKWLLDNAPTHCPLLGIELSYTAETSTPNCASIDRINSLKGYTQDNCKIISFKANRMKSNATLEEIEILARNLRDY